MPMYSVKNNPSTGRFEKLHGMSGTPEHKAWIGLRKRCYDTSHISYPHYGAKGITVCDEWNSSFEAFFAHMGKRPSPSHSVGRIDNGKGYGPLNCQWETAKQQQLNRDSARLLTFRGITKNLSEWADELGIHRTTVRQRIVFRGWSVERALTQPVGPNGKKKAA